MILFLSSRREERSEGVWFAVQPDKALEKRTLREISRHFYGELRTADSSLAAPGGSPAVKARPAAGGHPEPRRGPNHTWSYRANSAWPGATPRRC